MLRRRTNVDFESLVDLNRKEILNDLKKLNEIEERIDAKMHATLYIDQK
ncbi:FbpB family small basic protein [Paraliobacillus salinarum]|nr:FbpB family small basic protein [Paraliobacillus salinarum]